MTEIDEFARLLEVMHTLRHECPWDRKQTHDSLRPYLLEETYEVLHALDEGSTEALKEELGDLMLQIVFHAEVAQETDSFTIDDVLRGISDKMVRRHPHVFADVQADSADDVLRNWERIKRGEREKKSALDGVPDELPALLRASRTLSKIRQTGVDPFFARNAEDDIRTWLDYLAGGADAEEPADAERAVGMLVLGVTELASDVGVDPEDALRTTLERLSNAFRREESAAREGGRHLGDMTEAERDAVSERLLGETEEGA